MLSRIRVVIKVSRPVLWFINPAVFLFGLKLADAELSGLALL